MLIYSQIKIIRKEIKTMPIMDIRTLRLPKDKKDALAKGISEAVLPFIAPHFQIYFNEYEEIYLKLSFRLLPLIFKFISMSTRKYISTESRLPSLIPLQRL